MGDLTKQYQYLTTDERFRLFIEAMNRKDDQELDRLENTAPMEIYRCVDEEYKRRKVRFVDMALMSMIGWLRQDLHAAVALLIPRLRSRAVGEKNQDEAKLEDAFRKLFIESQGRREGWRRFCKSMGADPGPFMARAFGDTELPEGVLESFYEQFVGFEVAADETAIQTRADEELAVLVEMWDEWFPAGARH